MAVATVNGAPDPLDVELDRAGELIDRPVADLTDQLITAAGLLALWRSIFDRAMDRGDVKLANIAAGEWVHFDRAVRSLVGARAGPPSSPPRR